MAGDKCRSSPAEVLFTIHDDLQLIPQTYYKWITVSRRLNYIPRVAIFLAGVAAGALSAGSSRRRRPCWADATVIDGLKKSLTDLETRVAAQEAGTADHLQQIDRKLEEHAARMADVPSTSQIIAAMDQLLSKTMSSLDQRLTTQAQSIEILKTTVSQTDSLLERVLESLDSLQTCSEPSELLQDTLIQRPAV
jgi:uncharacterized coiled-coil protein SlyX